MLTISAVIASNTATTFAAIPIHSGIPLLYVHPPLLACAWERSDAAVLAGCQQGRHPDSDAARSERSPVLRARLGTGAKQAFRPEWLALRSPCGPGVMGMNRPRRGRGTPVTEPLLAHTLSDWSSANSPERRSYFGKDPRSGQPACRTNNVGGTASATPSSPGYPATATSCALTGRSFWATTCTAASPCAGWSSSSGWTSCSPASTVPTSVCTSCCTATSSVPAAG